ncbi:YncE family protein [Pseudothauera rhizosphaerae]|uniref:DNA-binding beta-propeller fold protein YncE n=1 Tax=Pseudothauera rhizosphaerae TaxID=2565932 RepID=A0A4S4ALP1_9RHOO|nr:hypothetical protein [Pseudothauera rhizosphaerae]THF60470.1 hypothetical protein E6O51_13410 [Pseudothauera rhizosphaerae]
MSSVFRLIRRCAFGLALFAALPAHAGNFGDVLRYLFVSHPAGSLVTVIDTRDDRIAGTLDVGLVPLQLEGSGDLAKLVAIDGRSPRVNLVELTGGRLASVALDFVPQRIVVSPNGLKAVAIAPEEGVFALVDLLFAVPLGPTRHHPQLHDLLFDRSGQVLHIADAEGIERFDTGTGRALGRIGPAGAVLRLDSSASGRHLYARTADGTIHSVALDPSAGTAGPGALAAGEGVARAYTNATGTRLFLPDSARRRISIVSPLTLRTEAVLPAAAGLGHVYSAWFDTVAFVASAEGPAVLVFDQEHAVRGADIPLSGVGGRGTVTPDGRKFYLPVADGHSLAVIDAEGRRLAKYIVLDAPPRAALMAVTFGICH